MAIPSRTRIPDSSSPRALRERYPRRRRRTPWTEIAGAVPCSVSTEAARMSPALPARCSRAATPGVCRLQGSAPGSGEPPQPSTEWRACLEPPKPESTEPARPSCLSHGPWSVPTRPENEILGVRASVLAVDDQVLSSDLDDLRVRIELPRGHLRTLPTGTMAFSAPGASVLLPVEAMVPSLACLPTPGPW